MSLSSQPLPPVPEDTTRIARAAFRRGNLYVLLRDRLGAVFADADFADLYPKLGQPAYAPWRLALVTLMQFREGLSDRQAAEAVRGRIDWKYLLALDLADAGFDFSVLCEFRGRPLQHGAAAAIMGKAYPDLYAAVGVHSGLPCGAAGDLPSALAAMRQGAPAGRAGARPAGERGRPVPTIVFHGDRDGTVSPRNGDQVIARARAAAAGELQATAAVQRGQASGGRAYSRTLHADADGKAALEQWVVHEAGHAWSGGSPAGSYTDPRGPDASREMLRFFLDHPHPAHRA